MEIYLKKNTGKIVGLNALRFFAALAVVFTHLGSYYFFKDTFLFTYYNLISGSTGVQFFYVISGFLITSLAVDEIRKNGYFDLKLFLLRRVLRLFPLYYLALFCIFLVSMLGWTQITNEGWFYALLYSYNYVPRESYNGLLGSFHTLGTEEHFYLVYGFLLACFFSSKTNLWIKMVFLFSLLFSFIYFNDSLSPFFYKTNASYFVNRWSLFAVDPIIIGCLTAIIIKTETFMRLIFFISESKSLSLLFYFSTLLFSFIFYFTYVYHLSLWFLSLGFSLLVVNLYFFRNSFLSHFLEVKLLSYLGSISYGLYIWQSVINGTGSNSRWIDNPYISTCLVFLVSIASYELYEKKFLYLKNKCRGKVLERNDKSEKDLKGEVSKISTL